MAFLLGSRNGERYSDWGSAIKQRPECRLDLPDTTTRRGIWTAKMHNSTVCRVLDGLVAAWASGSRQPDDMNEILRDIPPRRCMLPIPGPARGSPRVDETFPETGEWEKGERAPGIRIIICCCRYLESGRRQPRPRTMGGTAQPSSRLNRESAAKQIAGLSYLLLKFPSSFLMSGCWFWISQSVTLLSLAAEALRVLVRWSCGL